MVGALRGSGSEEIPIFDRCKEADVTEDTGKGVTDAMLLWG